MSTFSTTERQSFKRCRRSWYWSSFNGRALQPAFANAALNTGTVWHKGQELWALDAMEHDGRPLSHLVDCVNEAYGGVVVELEAATKLSTEDRYSLWEQWQLLEAMALNYEGHWGAPLEEGYIMIQPEQTVVVPVPNSPHFLEGTLDGLIKNQRNGLAYVLEHKTYGARPAEEILQFGDQYVAYLWILQQLGFQCGGVAYDGAWKRPAPTKGKSMYDLFLRLIITRNQAEIDEFGAFLPAELEEMEAARTNPNLRYPNKRWEGCWDCSAYKDLCHAESRGEPIDISGLAPRQPRERAEIWTPKGEA